MTKSIPLTKGRVAIVDDDDFAYLNQWRWKFNSRYAVRTSGGISHWKTISMHRVIMNAPDGMEVDHINGEELDNRKENLRICTRSENVRNVGKYRNNTSGFKGVSFDAEKVTRKWRALIQVDKKLISLGRYATPEEAARVYDEAAKKYHGKFAQLNFPEK